MIGVGTHVLPPTFTVDVIANLPFGVPVILFVLYGIYLQVDYLTRRAGAQGAPGTTAPTP